MHSGPLKTDVAFGERHCGLAVVGTTPAADVQSSVLGEDAWLGKHQKIHDGHERT